YAAGNPLTAHPLIRYAAGSPLTAHPLIRFAAGNPLTAHPLIRFAAGNLRSAVPYAAERHSANCAPWLTTNVSGLWNGEPRHGRLALCPLDPKTEQ
ncbi:MAG: hypothetical protein ACE5HA_15300, partial [Anaerolineae bacterium]